MKLDIVASSKNDEYYTPIYAIEPLLKYIKMAKDRKVSDMFNQAYLNGRNTILPHEDEFVIWCPFDTDDSNYVKLLKKDYTVIHTHIDCGNDFFELATVNFIRDNFIDCIISNPPYSKKTEVLERLFDLNVSFAMLVGVVGLFESQKRFNLFKNNEFEVMYFNKRVSFLSSFMDERPMVNPPFSSVYVCHNLLPDKIVFEELNKK